jgi:hypothetical protein
MPVDGRQDDKLLESRLPSQARGAQGLNAKC